MEGVMTLRTCEYLERVDDKGLSLDAVRLDNRHLVPVN